MIPTTICHILTSYTSLEKRRELESMNLAICTPTENQNKLLLSLLDKITHEQLHCRGTTNK